MFQDHGRLQEVLRLMRKLLQSDKRVGHLPRQDVEINRELITTAMEGWKA
jgi:hypothetical protein